MAGLLLILVLLGVAEALQKTVPKGIATAGLDSDRLYNLTNIWTIHLKFAPDQWEAMEPKGGFNPFGGGPGGGPGGFGGFSSARTLAPVFMSQGDLDRDGRLSREEFGSLAQRWFKAWEWPWWRSSGRPMISCAFASGLVFAYGDALTKTL